ncbi:probable disease resistance protein At4g14610 [Lactuca sativa]|uniref:probable disease resistance protein At4g14610 n=1 Tax=Lactuca sativa TaxID=4236 RepID=UPI000CB3A100|nr:probable disease resistance protein At4g14610 [Lactuca sativa]
MEFVLAIISPVIESIMVPVKKQLGYIFYSTKHVTNMNTKMKQLDAASLDVKNHMEEQLKRVAEDKKMFDYVVKVVIGQQIDMFSIQQTVAEYMGESLIETNKTTRADCLRITFGNPPKGRNKVLVILDDVWETIELEDIGPSPFPNDFKLLLTSRNKNICNKIAVEANLDMTLVIVDVMEEVEALNFFWQIIGVSKQDDVELNQIGSEIVRRCGFLHLAINFGSLSKLRNFSS